MPQITQLFVNYLPVVSVACFSPVLTSSESLAVKTVSLWHQSLTDELDPDESYSTAITQNKKKIISLLMHIHHSVAGGLLLAVLFPVLGPLFQPLFCGDQRRLDKLYATFKFLLGLYPLGVGFSGWLWNQEVTNPHDIWGTRCLWIYSWSHFQACCWWQVHRSSLLLLPSLSSPELSSHTSYKIWGSVSAKS